MSRSSGAQPSTLAPYPFRSRLTILKRLQAFVAIWLTAFVMFAGLSSLASADSFPPAWGTGTVNESTGPIHFAPAPWPSEPVDPLDCGVSCGEWQPYTRFQGDINDPRVQDPSNGGTAPQNYVNVSSSCIDKSFPSIYYRLYKHPTDAAQDVIMFRWRVEQIAHNYATGPSAGNYGATDPWSSGLWTVLFDVDGDGYRDLAAHLNGSSGDPSHPVDMIAGIWGNIPTQSIDYLTDPSVKLIAHNPTAFTSGSRLLNFNGNYPAAPNTTWPNGSVSNSWDYGTSRAKLVSSNSCNEYFVDYQIPARMLDASSTGPNATLNGPKITRNTPISMLFCTANSLNNPFQKDCSLNRNFLGDATKPGPFGDYLSFNKDEPYSQPIVSSVTATAPNTCPGNYTLTAKVQDTLYVDDTGVIKPSVQEVKFYYWYDKDGDGTTAGDTGSAWTETATGALKSGTLNTWTASWDATALLKGKYLVGVQAVDDKMLHDDGVSDAPIDNRTFSYLTGSAAEATQAQIYINPWSFDGASKTWVSGGAGGWIAGEEAAFPSHSPAMTTGPDENWYGNPDVTGLQTAVIGVAINACGFAPTITKTSNLASVTVGEDVTFTLTIANPAGNTDISVTQIQDILPSGFSYNTGSTSVTGLGTFSGDPANVANTLTWTGAATLSGGSSGTLSFTAEANITGAYSNTATAVVNEFGTLTSDPLQLGVGAARLSISKTPSTYSAVPGDPVTYTIVYSNDSPMNANNVVITDTIPDGLTYVSCTGGCARAGDTLTWTIGALGSGEGPYQVSYSATITAPYPGTAAVPNVNTATIDSDNTDPASATASLYVSTPRPQLTLNKTANAIVVAPGANVTFTLAYANTGDASATNVILSDLLPSGFTFVSCTNSCTNPGVGSNGTVSWSLGTLAVGASGSVTVTAQASSPYTGTSNPATNTASISATEVGTPVTDSADVGVTQSGSVCTTYYFRTDTGDVGFDGTKRLASLFPVPQIADVGGSTLITVPGGANNYSATILDFYQEPAAASDTVFSGNLTTNIYLDRNSGPGITIRATVYDYNSADGTRSQIGQATRSFAGSATGLLTFTVPLSGTQSKNHRLLWTYEATSNNTQSTDLLFQYDGTVSNSVSDTTAPIATTFANSRADFCVTPPANLVLEKSVDTPSINVTGSGRTLTYTLNYANTSSATAANNAEIVDTLPTSGVSYSGCSLGGSTHFDRCTVAAGVVTIDAVAGATIPADGSGSVTITVNVNNDLSGISSLTNTAQIQSDQTALAPAGGATATTTVSGAVSNPAGTPNVILSKSANATLLLPNGTVTYTLTALNAGDKTANTVVISDDFPDQPYFTYGSCVTATGSCSESPAGSLTWNVGSLTPGQSATLTFTMAVGANPPAGVTELDNSASATYDGGGPAASNTVTVSISTNPNLGLTKSVSDLNGDALAPGDTLRYTLVVSNTGSGSASDVVVSDPIPAYTSYLGNISATTGSGAFDAIDNRVVFTIGTLASSASATLTFDVALASPLPSGSTTVANTASASSSNAASRTASVNSSASAAPVLEISKSGPATLPYPAATLTAAATASTTLFVDSTALIEVGQYVQVGGAQALVTAVNGTSLNVNATLTGSAGAAVTVAATYTLTYQNTGNADASGVEITDTLPAGMGYFASSPVADSDPGAGNSGAVTWNIGALAAGASGSAQVIAFPNAAGTVTNTSSIDSTETTPVSDTLDTIIGGLTATKETGTPEVAASTGAPLNSASYRITVNNSTVFAINAVEVKDLLPAGFTYLTGSTLVDDSGGGSNTTEPAFEQGDSGRPIWTIDVPANGWVTIAFDAEIAVSVGPATYQNGVELTKAGVGVTPFDPFATTAEDVTVLASGTGLVSGTVYKDNDGNGDFDATIDTPLGGIAMTIIDDTGVVFVVYTDAAGYFRHVVSAGSTIIDVDNGSLPGTLVLTTSPADNVDPGPVIVPDGGSASRDTGFVPASGAVGTISGVVYHDNGAGSGTASDGIQNGSEAGLLGMLVNLRDAVTGDIVATAYTDVLGNYSFPNMPVGDYEVDLVPASPYFVTSANDPAPVTVTAGGNARVDFGLHAGWTLSGEVFEDNGAGGGTSSDAIQNGTESGTDAGDLNVVIVNGSNLVLAVAIVGSDGVWSAGVPPGSGYVAYITTASPTVGDTVSPSALLPAGWRVTGENVTGVPDASANGILTGINATTDASALNFGITSSTPEPEPELVHEIPALSELALLLFAVLLTLIAAGHLRRHV